jgi:hypothetical protein
MTGCGGAHLSVTATWGSTNRRMKIQVDQGIKRDPISKITNAKRTWHGSSSRVPV